MRSEVVSDDADERAARQPTSASLGVVASIAHRLGAAGPTLAPAGGAELRIARHAIGVPLRSSAGATTR